MLKRGLSVFLAAALMILCFFSVPVFAAEPEFDISDYTIEDLETMTTAEKKKLMEDFIEAYNPYGLRDLMEQEASASGEFGVQPLWKSDGDDSEIGQQMATHQLITLEALNVFISDYGFYEANGSTALVVALSLASASGLPDMLETDALTFSGHFYDPDTGKNWTRTTWPTAKTRASSHYDRAKTALNKDTTPEMPDLLGENFEDALKQLGMSLHYVQDVCEPHHAANKTAGISTHTEFENHIELHISSLMPSVSTISSVFYGRGRTKNIGDLTHEAAVIGKIYIDQTAEEYQSQWDEVGKTCLENSIWHSARVIYKFFYETNASFIK